MPPSSGHFRDTGTTRTHRASRHPFGQLETRTSRLKLPVAKKPIFVVIAKGIALGYRRNHGAGSWVARASDGKGGNWIKGFAIADDHEDSDGEKVLTFWQAQERARKLARGQDADAGRPVTVDEALTTTRRTWRCAVQARSTPHRVRNLLPAELLAKPVGLLVRGAAEVAQRPAGAAA